MWTKKISKEVRSNKDSYGTKNVQLNTLLDVWVMKY